MVVSRQVSMRHACCSGFEGDALVPLVSQPPPQNVVRHLREEALHAWNSEGHPGWEVTLYDSDKWCKVGTNSMHMCIVLALGLRL